MWKFKEITHGEPERMPRETEFFTGGKLDVACSLVRESTQNAQDAASALPVRIRYTLFDDNISSESIYYKELLPHVNYSKILNNKPLSNQKIRTLLIEDFNTTGLTGSLVWQENNEDKPSNYYNFWWREGIAQKQGAQGGRWGLGKITYHAASKLRSVFGLTVRLDDGKILLLGKSILKPHAIDNKRFDYFGYYAGPNYEPISGSIEINKFIENFNLSRKHEAGLSLVIPMVVEEITEESLIKDSIMHCFLPILKGNLIIEVKPENGELTVINDETIKNIAESLNWEGTSWQNKDANSIIEFATTALNLIHNGQCHKLNIKDTQLAITEDAFGDLLPSLRDKFTNNHILAFEIPISIAKKGHPAEDTSFYIVLQHDERLEQADEYYWRSGILVSDMRKLGQQKIRAILTGDNTVISKFLGDSETPAHSQWNERTDGFKDNYENSVRKLRFIKGSIKELARVLNIPSSEIQTDFLKDIFYITGNSDKGDDNGGEIVLPLPPPPPPKPKHFSISNINGGLSINLTETAKTLLPIKAEISIAYDIRKGNPFTKYVKWDFEINKMNCKIKNGAAKAIAGNIVQVTAKKPGFHFSITGFDTKRDLVVSIREITE
jgi:hypothetical protein